MVGDGPEGQPTDGVATLDAIAGLMGEGGEEMDAPVESDSEDSDEAEGVELEADGAEDDESAEADDSEDAEEPTFTIKVDGKDVTLKQSELIEQAQKGFDYTQKTMKVAEERKAAEAARQVAEQYRHQVEQHHEAQLHRLQALEQFMAEQVGAPPPIEWAQQDAAYYLAQKELYESRKGQLEQTKQAIEHLQQERQQYRQAFLRSKADEAERVLRDTLPGWSEERMDGLAKSLTDYGLTPEAMDAAFFEPGLWRMAHEASEYRRLMAKKEAVKPVLKNAAKVAKPTANNQPPQLARRQEAIKRFDKSPNLRDLSQLVG
jgi:hypothetical protein